MTPHTTGSTQSTRSIRFTDSDHQAAREAQEVARRHLPLSVWLAAADEAVAACSAGCCVPVSGPLARHLVSACTRLGDTAVHIGATDHQLISNALSMGCRATAAFTDPALAGVTWTRLTRKHPEHDLQVAELRVTRPEGTYPALAKLSGTAALVVVQQACARSSATQPADLPARRGDLLNVALAAALLKPGGHLAVVTGLHRAEDRVVDPAPQIIARAQRAGLVYLQHIIALRCPARGEQVDPVVSHRAVTAAQALPECAGLPFSARVHTDVLLFTKPARPAGSCGLNGRLDEVGAHTPEEAASSEIGGGR